MNSTPIILRELRSESRHPFNHWLRVCSAGSGIIILAVIVGFEPGNSFRIGARLFTAIHTTIFVFIWLVVPVLTADCLARERREGTLPLLFLTPLTPRGVVIGKSFAHLLRGLVLLLAVWPILSIPLLLGGVTSNDIAAAATFEFSALLASFSAGLVASACSRKWLRAIILAEISAGLSFFLFGCGFALCSALAAQTLSLNLPWEHVTLPEFFQNILMLSTGITGIWRDVSRDVNLAPIWHNALALFVLFNCFLLAAAIALAGECIRHGWRENPLGPRAARLLKLFTTPLFFRRKLRASLGRRLNRNPIAWLQRYSWSARLTEWGWFAFCMVIMTEMIVEGSNSYSSEPIRGSAWLGLILLAGVAFSSVSSFQREKENGVLELLLVTPLTDSQIVWGRVRGIWGQFAPAIFLMTFARIYLWPSYRAFEGGNHFLVYLLFVFWGSFFLAPVFGLYFALRSRTLLAAWLQTCILALAAPIFLAYWLVLHFSESLSWSYTPGIVFGMTNTFWTTQIFIYVLFWSILSIAALKLLFNLLHSRAFTARHHA